MVDRAEWGGLKFDLSESKIDIYDLHMNAIKFYDSISKANISSMDEVSTILMDAEAYCKNCIRIIKSSLSPQDNDVIKMQNNYDWLIDNLGVVDRKIKSLKHETVQQLETSELLGKKPIAKIKLKAYKDFLIEIMDHLVFYPLRNSYKKFINDDFSWIKKEDKKQKKDKEMKRNTKLYWGIVFSEFLSSSDLLGSITSESISAPKNVGKLMQVPTRSLIKAVRKINRNDGGTTEESEGEEDGEEESEQQEDEDVSTDN